MGDENIRIGTAGYSYKDWLGNFYPQFCPQADFLRYYSSKYTTVELDVTFYRIPSEKMIQGWLKNSPDNFIFTAKFPRTVTHEGTIPERLEQMEIFIKTIAGLGEKLGPLLFQFPYSFKPENRLTLYTLLNNLPDNLEIAVELRNKKWLDDSLYASLTSKSIALCQIDHPWMPKLDVNTGGFNYIRFLGDHKKLTEDFSYVRLERAEELEWWSKLIKRNADKSRNIYAYFNNHYSGHAPTTADRLKELLLNL